MADATIGTAYLQVVPKLDQKSISSQSVTAGKSTGDGIATGLSAKAVAIGNIMSNIFTEAASKVGELVSDVFVGAFENAAEYEQLIGGVEKLFGDAADSVKGYAQQAYRTAGVSANDYMRQATSFSASLISSLEGDQQRAAEITDMAIQDMADNANVFGSNITDIQNAYQGFAKQNYTMLDNLKLGYGGTKTEMERLLADAQEFSGIEYNIDSLSDVYEAIHVIQQEMEITGTTSKEAAGTIEGSMSQAKAAFDNWLTAIGTGEGVQEATQALFDAIVAAAQNIIPAIGQIFESIGTLIVESFTEAFPELAESISGVVDTLSNIFGGIAERLQPVFDAIAPFAEGLADILYSTICAAFDFLAGAIQTVADILSYVWDNILVPFATWCQETFGPIIEAVGGFFEGVANIVGSSNQEIVDSTMVMYGNVDSTWRNMRQNADGTWSYVENKVGSSVKGAESAVDTATANIANDMKFDGVSGAVANEFDAAESAIDSALSGAESDASAAASNIVSPFWGIGDKITRAFGSISFPKAHITYREMDVIGKTIRIPNVEWYARGGFVVEPTLIGAGEAGAEMILPAQGGLMNQFADAISEKLHGGVTVYLQYDAGEDANQLATDIAHALERKLALEGAA